ncbi:MAG: methyltransferase domain-containing protein [Patescibacteria group bacterium]
MESKEFYTRKEIPQEEMDRLKETAYPSWLSGTVLNKFDLDGKKVLDSGAGPNSMLAVFVFEKGGTYVHLDCREDVLATMKSQLDSIGRPYHGVQADLTKKLDFPDKFFDIVHQRFVLMHIAPEKRKQVLEESLRVAKESVVLIEYDWRMFQSTKNPETIERIKHLAFPFFERFSADPYMGEKFEELFSEIDTGIEYSIQRFRREENVSNTPDLIGLLKSFSSAAKHVLKDEDLAHKFGNLIEELEKSPISYSPPDYVVATIKV